MQTTLFRLLPAPMRRSATPARLMMAAQFLRFGVVGLIGLIVDTSTVYALRHSLGLHALDVALKDKAVARGLLVNFAQMMVFRSRDPETIDYLQRLLGKTERTKVSYSNSETETKDGGSSGVTTSTSTAYEDLVTPQAFRDLREGEAFALTSVGGKSFDDIIQCKHVGENQL